MALKIRLARGGAKKRPFYRMVVAENTAPRDGKFVERVGSYNPLLERGSADRVVVNTERVKYWLSVGAQASERVVKILADLQLVQPLSRRETPKKSAPKKKALERLKAAEEAARAATEKAAEPTAPAEEAQSEVAPETVLVEPETTSSEEEAARVATSEKAAAEPTAPAEEAQPEVESTVSIEPGAAPVEPETASSDEGIPSESADPVAEAVNDVPAEPAGDPAGDEEG